MRHLINQPHRAIERMEKATLIAIYILQSVLCRNGFEEEELGLGVTWMPEW